jgi:hypothetical protein
MRIPFLKEISKGKEILGPGLRSEICSVIGRNMTPYQTYPHPNPWNLYLCHLT